MGGSRKGALIQKPCRLHTCPKSLQLPACGDTALMAQHPPPTRVSYVHTAPCTLGPGFGQATCWTEAASAPLQGDGGALLEISSGPSISPSLGQSIRCRFRL